MFSGIFTLTSYNITSGSPPKHGAVFINKALMGINIATNPVSLALLEYFWDWRNNFSSWQTNSIQKGKAIEISKKIFVSFPWISHRNKKHTSIPQQMFSCTLDLSTYSQFVLHWVFLGLVPEEKQHLFPRLSFKNERNIQKKRWRKQKKDLSNTTLIPLKRDITTRVIDMKFTTKIGVWNMQILCRKVHHIIHSLKAATKRQWAINNNPKLV